jgi:hypothetical protein
MKTSRSYASGGSVVRSSAKAVVANNRILSWLASTILSILLLQAIAEGVQSAEIAEWSGTGRDPYEKCASSDQMVAHACGEYLLGLLDGVVISMPPNAQLVCPSANLSFLQLETAYLNWAKANADLLGKDRGISAASALAATFPCPNGNDRNRMVLEKAEKEAKRRDGTEKKPRSKLSCRRSRKRRQERKA